MSNEPTTPARATEAGKNPRFTEEERRWAWEYAAKCAERIARVEELRGIPSYCPLVALPMHGGGTVEIDPAEVALLMEDTPDLPICHVNLRGSGFAGTVALTRAEVKALLWPVLP